MLCRWSVGQNLIFMGCSQPDEQRYAIRSYGEDVEMRDAETEDEEDEEAVESELAELEEGLCL